MQTAEKLSQGQQGASRHLSLMAVACSCLIFISACNGEDNSDLVILPNESLSEDNIVSEQTESEQTGNEIDMHSDNQLPHIVRFTDAGENLWPPQPKDITNLQPVETQPTESAQSTTNANAQVRKSAEAPVNINLVLENNTVVEAIGDRYAVLANHEATNKAGKISTEVEIFNYSDNLLVTVYISAGGDITVKKATASDYQPAESKVEVQHAITLARKKLSSDGYLDHEQLTGTGLLAHPTAAEVAKSGKQFYSQRKIYVTFGVGGGVVPNYRALVNLSNEVVEQSGPIQ